MGLKPDDHDWSLAREHVAQYRKKPGSERIATEFALAHISALQYAHSPARILEFGTGIGTIADFLLSHPNAPAHVTATETNEFCIDQFGHNLARHESGKVRLVTGLEELLEIKPDFDLVIFDGGFFVDEQFRFLTNGTMCLVEGNRASTRADINTALRPEGLECQFTHYHRGRRLIKFSWVNRNRKHLIFPKVRINKYRKGCWIGTVQPIRS